jgi:hypothetical protein
MSSTSGALIPNLQIEFEPSLKHVFSTAIARRRANKVALFGPLLIQDSTLHVSPFDLPSLLECVERMFETELGLFRVRRAARSELRRRLLRSRRPEVIRAYRDALDYLAKCGVGHSQTLDLSRPYK